MIGAFHGRDAQHHPGRLAHGHGDAARLVGRDHLAGDLGGQGGGLADDADGQHQVEAGPALGGADLAHHRVDEGRGLGLQGVGGLGQEGAAGVGAQGAPAGEGGLGGVGRGLRLGDGHGRRGGGDRAGDRIEALEGGAARQRAGVAKVSVVLMIDPSVMLWPARPAACWDFGCRFDEAWREAG
jgi:hypothetical protein